MEKDMLYVGEKYISATNILIEGMIRDQNLIISDCEIPMEEIENRRKSCAFYVILPCFFCLYQGIELILKGFVNIKNGKEKYGHDVPKLLQNFEKFYNDQKELIYLFDKFINNPIDLIRIYKDKNRINEISLFYNSLRYPDDIKKTVLYDYSIMLHPMDHYKFIPKMIALKKDINNLMKYSSALLLQLEKENSIMEKR